MRVCCQHPAIILNPLAYELIAKYGNYTLCGVRFEVPKSKYKIYKFDEKILSPSYTNIDSSSVDSCYITNRFSGKRYPLYLQVPCGNCDCCKKNAIASFVHRCELETQMYDSLPVFITLTYENKNLPETGLSLRDLQLFFKRFRINLERQGYRERIRYVACGEYGRRTKRPHYHLVIWNLHQTNMVSYRQIRATIERSWNKGIIRARFVDASDNKTFRYTAKYLRKDSCMPCGRAQKPGICGLQKPFICSSNRNGGIGAQFLKSLQYHIVREMDTKPHFLNKFSGQVKPLQLNRFVLNKLFPTLSRSIPSEVKRSLRVLAYAHAYFHRQQRYNDNLRFIDKDFIRYYDFFSQYIYCPRLSNFDIVNLGSLGYISENHLVRDVVQAVIVLECWYQRGKEYFDRAKILDKKRERYLVKLFEHVQDITEEAIAMKSYQYRKSAAAAAERELF